LAEIFEVNVAELLNLEKSNMQNITLRVTETMVVRKKFIKLLQLFGIARRQNRLNSNTAVIKKAIQKISEAKSKTYQH
jgi:hypothetical protein